MLESIVKKVLVTEEEIETIVSRLAEEINRDYADKNLITEEAYAGKTIDVKGIVDFYDGAYQIKVFSADNIIIKYLITLTKLNIRYQKIYLYLTTQ